MEATPGRKEYHKQRAPEESIPIPSTQDASKNTKLAEKKKMFLSILAPSLMGMKSLGE